MITRGYGAQPRDVDALCIGLCTLHAGPAQGREPRKDKYPDAPLHRFLSENYQSKRCQLIPKR
jgi:hypothetical protein